MIDGLSTRLSVLNDMRDEVHTTLERLRRAQRRYGYCDLTPVQQAQLLNRIKSVRRDVARLVADTTATRSADTHSRLLLQVARCVLTDCSETASLLQ
jgi:hypothetical protein